ncbi:MAG: histidine kinase N-terminal 7TM domain-containing protein [Alkalilacustris sp.]
MAECLQLHPALPIDRIAAAMLLALLAAGLRVAWAHSFHGKGFFLASLVGAGLWLGAITLEHRAVTEACKIVWAQAAWLGIALLPTALCFFIDDYARARNRWRDPRRRLLLVGGPLAVLGMAASNGWHGAFYGPATGLASSGPGAQVVFDHGPLFYLAAAWLYGFVVAGVTVLLRGLRAAHPAHRPFFLGWLLVLVLPIAANLGHLFGGLKLWALDPTAYAYALAMTVLSWSIITDRLQDLRAVALEVLWRSAPSPILVVLPDGRVVAANPAALALVEARRRPARLADWGPLAPHADLLLAPGPPDGAQTLRLGDRSYDLRMLPIETPLDRRREMGRVLRLDDVTRRHELEARLAAERDFLHLLMQTTMTGIVALDGAGRVIFANAEVGRLTGHPADRLPGMDHATLFPPAGDALGPGVACFASAIGAGAPRRQAQVGVRRADGTPRMLSVNVAHLDRTGVEARVVCALADITEALETARSLEAARDRAEAASRTKSQFLANMSHEIRTPLNGVLGMAELLEEALEDPHTRTMARTIRDSGATLLSVLNDVLDMSRIEAGRLQIEARPFAPAEIAARIGALHAAAAEGKGLGFAVLGPGAGLPDRVGDMHRILQVLHNLVGNAIKFTETGRVTVEIEAPAGAPLLIRVCDTGIGMTEDEARRIFAEFEQADGSTARRFGGTGLGLTITRGLVDQMGGEIALRTAPSRGTTVTVRLPLPEHAAAPTMPAPGAEPVRPARPLAGLSLLAADDNAVNRTLLGLMLERAGASVTLLDGGAAVLAAWRPGAHDAVLLDISMPDLDGIATLAALNRRAAELGAAPPVAIAITANVMTHQVAEYRAAGFAGHAGKPFQAARLVAEIQRAIAATVPPPDAAPTASPPPAPPLPAPPAPAPPAPAPPVPPPAALAPAALAPADTPRHTPPR